MQSFGLIGLIIVIAIAAWWLMGGSMSPASVSDPADGQASYSESIDAAKEAVNLIEGQNIPLSSEAVFVYDGISMPVDTRVLNLSARGLSGSLKAEIRHLRNLEVLNISNNNFTGLPAEVGQLSRLKVLDLSNNPITGLPYEIGNLQNLEQLNLKGTNYAEVYLAIINASLPASTVIITE